MRADLHPALKKEITSLRFQQGALLTLSSIIGGACALDGMWVVGGMIWTLSLWAAWQLGRRAVSHFYRVDWLLKRTAPRTVQMAGTGLSCFTKHLVRFQIVETGSENVAPFYSLLRSPGREGPSVEGTEGVLHAVKVGENAELVIRSGGDLHTGRRVDMEAGIAELQRNKIAEIGVWALIALVVGGVAIQSAFDIGNRKERARMAADSTSWHAAEGTVMSGRIVTHSGGGHAGGTCYEVRIEYVYTVSGEECVGNRLHFCDRKCHRKQKNARAVLRRYPPDISVTVYYHPGNPSLSVLETGDGGQCRGFVQAAWRMMFMYGAIAVFFGWGARMRWRGFRQIRLELLESRQ